MDISVDKGISKIYNRGMSRGIQGTDKGTPGSGEVPGISMDYICGITGINEGFPKE